MMYSKNNKISIRNGIPWQQDGEKALILDSDESFAHELNSSALFIWKNIAIDTNYESLLEKFTQEFDADHTTLKHDLDQTLNQLDQLGLIKVVR